MSKVSKDRRKLEKTALSLVGKATTLEQVELAVRIYNILANHAPNEVLCLAISDLDNLLKCDIVSTATK